MFMLFYKFLYKITGKKEFRNIYKYNHKLKNNKIIIIQNGQEEVLPPYTHIEGLNIQFLSNNNTVKIELPIKLKDSTICFHNDNNLVYFGQNTLGVFSLNLFRENNSVYIGRGIQSNGFGCTLHGDQLQIGDKCMFSNSIKLWTDGHSVIDEKTKDLLNKPNHEIKIGNHVWIGENVVLLKRTQIPSNSIVAHSSVVTKAFQEENVVIAGNPASIVKKGINWNFTPPNYYDKNTADLSF